MEIALWTQPDRIEVHGTSTYRKLKGAVCVGVTTERIRRKWVEIASDLIRPERRGGPIDIGALTKPLQEAWKPEWYQAFRAMERREITPDEAWGTMVTGLPDLGKDPRGEVPIEDTWRWTEKERRMFCLLRLDLEDESVARKIHYMRDDKRCLGYANGIDYATNLGLSLADVTGIENTSLVVHPKLTVDVGADKVEPVCSPGDIIDG